MIPPFILLSAAETKSVEADAIKGGHSGAAMMEAAGAAAASFIIRIIPKRPVAVLCGPGNNGGDGFVVARKLKEEGWTVRLGLVGDRNYLKGDAALMAGLYDGDVEALSPSLLEGAGLIVDAIFGTGLARAIESPEREIIEAANAHAAPKIAIDIPSGVDADTGAVLGVAVQANATVTFIARKPGHLLFPGRALSGAVQLADIGVRDELVAALAPRLFENHPALWAGRWRRPGFTTHKYDRGHAAIISGPRLKTGAARLAAMSALRAGAGLVTMLSPADACDENAAHLTAVMLREAQGAAAIAEALADKRFTAALIGPGAGVGPGTKDCVLTILNSSAGAILDADALTSFEGDAASLLAALRPDDVMTPHAGEFARLFPALKDKPRLEAARAAAAQAKAVIVLKGADTIIAAPDGRAIINSNAPFDLATAGAGDVLAGVIAGMRAQGMPGFEAAAAGAWLHGAAAQRIGPGLIAEDLPNALPQVMRALFAPPEPQRPPG
ncbi:MAG: NAD(P)H-hydrate dehydratase, partial [Parvularculaceae bacterium]